jgi:branched-subunit amino acid aminotransferase/4-amino-4-deoxychorismate lyase
MAMGGYAVQARRGKSRYAGSASAAATSFSATRQHTETSTCRPGHNPVCKQLHVGAAHARGTHSPHACAGVSQGGVFDCLLVNEHGDITETSIANIAIETVRVALPAQIATEWW